MPRPRASAPVTGPGDGGARNGYRSPPMRALLLPLFLCAACGGGGGASAVVPQEALKLQVGDAVLAVNETSASVDITLASVPANTALLQFDVVMDPDRLGPSTGRTPLQALQTRPTVDGDDVGGGAYRVVFGDGRNREPLALTTGPIARLWLESRPPRTPGPVAVRIERIIPVDATGNVLTVDSAPVSATVTLH